MDEKTADLFNPKVVRSSMGAVLHVPFYYEKEWNRRLAYLKEEGFILYAAHLEGDLLYDEADCTGCCAFLIGNESAGLARETIARADAGIRIPLSEGAESLNAGVAASILLFEADRQRRRRDGG